MNLFNFLKKEIDNNIYSPVNGFCVDITKCKDETFSSKLVGDGFAVVSEEDEICSPCDGVVEMIFPTLHAFGIKKENGDEVLVHIGIDTVKLNGKHFKQLCDPQKKVKKGTPIIKFDNQAIKSLGYDTSVMIVVTGKNNLKKNHLDENVSKKDIIIEEN